MKEKDEIITDLLLKVVVLEKIVLDKGIVTKEEYIQILDEVAQKISDKLLEKVNIKT